MIRLLQAEGIGPQQIDVDKLARNTIENAIYVLPHICSQRPTEVLLVTSDFHMPRSFFVFASVFRHAGLSVHMLQASASPSRLDVGAPRATPPREINDWRYSERIQHERKLMNNRMKRWIESHDVADSHGRVRPIRVNEDDFQRATHQLQELADART